MKLAGVFIVVSVDAQKSNRVQRRCGLSLQSESDNVPLCSCQRQMCDQTTYSHIPFKKQQQVNKRSEMQMFFLFQRIFLGSSDLKHPAEPVSAVQPGTHGVFICVNKLLWSN